MNTIGEKSTTVFPSTVKYTPHHRLTKYFEEMDRKRKTSPGGPNKTNNSSGGDPPNDGNKKHTVIAASEEKNSGLLAVFIASTILAIGTNKLNAFAVFGEKVADFINASLSGVSLSLGAITLTKYLTKSLPEAAEK